MLYIIYIIIQTIYDIIHLKLIISHLKLVMISSSSGLRPPLHIAISPSGNQSIISSLSSLLVLPSFALLNQLSGIGNGRLLRIQDLVLPSLFVFESAAFVAKQLSRSSSTGSMLSAPFLSLMA